MAVYLVTYDLITPGKNYTPLLDAIRKYTNCYALKSAFFIDTLESEVTVAKKLVQLIDGNDKLYVMEITKHWAANKKMVCTDWLNAPVRTFGKRVA
nr:hypothetical protein RAR13_00060 [Aminobacter aminovorans]